MSADLDDRAMTPDPDPEVVGIRVWIAGATEPRDHPRGRGWFSNADAELGVENEDGDDIALYAAGAWQSVEQITAPAHP